LVILGYQLPKSSLRLPVQTPSWRISAPFEWDAATCRLDRKPRLNDPKAGMLTSRSASRVISVKPYPLICIRSILSIRCASSRAVLSAGTATPLPDDTVQRPPRSPFYFETGYALYAKRPSRPFPPPFLSLPSGSFSDPLSTHNRSRDRRSFVNGEMIRGVTNGDDAVLVEENFIGANDGVGAWATRPKGHAA